MQPEQMKQTLDRIEQCADDMVRALKSASGAPDALRRSVESLHQKASEAKRQPMTDDASFKDCVMQLEQLADDAMKACRETGGIDQQLQEAVKRGHAELSRQKHALGATA